MKTTKKQTQCQRLLAYLKKHRRGITTMEAALELGIFRLSERIREIEGVAYNYFPQAHITRHREKTGSGATVTRYKLAR